MKAKSLVQKIITWPGDISLRFLLWHDEQHIVWRCLLIIVVLPAQVLMIAADTIDDVFDHYKKD